jgi:hypothetical protein
VSGWEHNIGILQLFGLLTMLSGLTRNSLRRGEERVIVVYDSHECSLLAGTGCNCVRERS